MKIQSIFILFNIILAFFIVIISFFPVLMLGADMASMFWRYYWFLLIAFVFLLGFFNSFFLINRRLYNLLEKEDWPALVHYLEDKILRQGKYTKALVRLLANSYIILSDFPAVINLENRAAMVKTSLVDDYALVFGTARILAKDYLGALRFFEARLISPRRRLREWMHWYVAFSLVLNRRYERAWEEFSRLIRTSEDKVIIGLSSYFLSKSILKALPEKRSALESAAGEGRTMVFKALPQQRDWDRKLSKIRKEVHGMVLSKIFDEAGQWLYTPIDELKEKDLKNEMFSEIFQIK